MELLTEKDFSEITVSEISKKAGINRSTFYANFIDIDDLSRNIKEKLLEDFRKIYENERLRALVSVTIDHDLAVHDLKVISGPERLFVAMPSRKDESGIFRDVVHPITPEARKLLEDSVLAAYDEHLTRLEAENEFEME